jgi:hypothetical protein
MSDTHREETGTEITPRKARQAIIGHHVVLVLALSLTLALIVGTVLLAWFWANSAGLG